MQILFFPTLATYSAHLTLLGQGLVEVKLIKTIISTHNWQLHYVVLSLAQFKSLSFLKTYLYFHTLLFPVYFLSCLLILYLLVNVLYSFSSKNARCCTVNFLFRQLYCHRQAKISQKNFFFVFGETGPPPNPPVGQGFLIHEVSRSHTTSHHGR